MKVTCDAAVDAAYIYLDERRQSGYVKRTEPLDLRGVAGEVFLDFDAEGRMVGIEVLGASKVLPTQLIDKAEKPVVEARQ